MSFSIRELRPGDVRDFPILPEWETGTAEELDQALTEDGRATAILRDGEVIGAIWYKPDPDYNTQIISAWKYRPTKDLILFVRELIAIIHSCNPDRVMYTISANHKKSDRWHNFIGLTEKKFYNEKESFYATGGTKCQKA